MAAFTSTTSTTFCLSSKNTTKFLKFLLTKTVVSFPKPKLTAATSHFRLISRWAFSNSSFKKLSRVFCSTLPTVSTSTTHYEVQHSGFLQTLINTSCLYERIKPGETIWYIDDDELVVNLKKQDPELNWPDIIESWESLTAGVTQLLQGTSVYLVGESTEINQKIARELAVGLGYTPLETKELVEAFAKQTIDSWVAVEGYDAVAEVEGAILENLSSHARKVVATIGGKHGAASRTTQWRHLFAGFTVWLSESEATDEASARDEATRHFEDGVQGFSNAEVVVKLGGWDANYSKTVAQASLSALKRLILSDRKLPGKKSLYVRLGCRGDWPDIKPPGCNPSTTDDASLPGS